ncbi:MAG: hypothetical protein B6I20_01380 [Bacteroidetes bacterium 4572_117]|nr:MAG: hypothetical protein B6I20_01380 [Bacteroidetes bacterium 4572_117]
MRINFKFKESILVNILLFVFFIIFIILAYLSEGTYGGADDITHYRFSRYAFQYPEFFLNHWAKPVFTLLSSPFAQFGFIGMKFFNVIIGTLTTFYTYKTAKKLGLKNSVLVILFTFSSVLYPALMITGMTEILFSFVLIVSILLLLNKRYVFSAIVLSFLPLVRTEGIVLLVVFVFAFLYYKKYYQLIFLSSGAFIYSVIGWFYYNDFLWLITKMPYGDSTDIYGTGNLFYFIEQSKNIFGILLSILISIGIIIILFFLLKPKLNRLNYDNLKVFLLILLPASAYYWAHSFSWYLGIGSSLGLIRVMAAIIPLFAIIALISYNYIIEKIKLKKQFSNIVSVIIIILLFHSTLSVNTFPVPLREKNQLIKDASIWLINSEYRNNKVYYYDPYFFFFMDKNPYDNTIMEEFIPDKEKPGNKMKNNEILIWDAHFSPNEGRLALSKVEQSKLLRKIKVFKPKNKFTVLGGYEYQIIFFQRIN